MVAMISPTSRPRAAPSTKTGKKTPEGMGRETAMAVKKNCIRKEVNSKVERERRKERGREREGERERKREREGVNLNDTEQQ